MPEPYFDPVTIDTQVFELLHLNPFTFEFESELAKKTLRVHVTFTDHCFTRKCDVATVPAGYPVFHAKTSKPRTFCPTRYLLSLDLPGVILSLNHPKIKVWETASERNWAHSVVVENPSGPYHVFFKVSRSAAHQKALQDINLVVESAYHQDPEKGPPKLLGTMLFYLLCGKVYKRLPTATKR